MKTNSLSILFILITILFSGCSDFFVSDVNEKDFPGAAPLLVIKSLLCPEDTVIMVAVAKTRPVFTSNGGDWDNPFDFISNANVTLQSGNNTYQLVYNENLEIYKLRGADTNLRVKPGETYKIDVSVPGFRAVTASTSIPLHVPQSAFLTSIDTNYSFENGTETIEYSFSLKDIANETNFYSAQLTIRFIYPDSNYYYETFLPKEVQVSDAGHDGELLKFTFTTDNYYHYGGLVVDTNALLTINSYDEPIWLYNAVLGRLDGSDDGNPFAEPVFAYTNVTNGRGLFSSFRRLDAHVILKNKK